MSDAAPKSELGSDLKRGEPESTRPYTARVDRLRSKIDDEGVDALWVTGATNRRYLTGFVGSAGNVVVTRDATMLLVDFRYVQQAKQQAPECDVIEIKKVDDALRDLVGARGFARFGFETEWLTHHQFEKVRTAVPDVEWVPLKGLVERLRAVKDSGEMKRLRRAIALGDRAFDHIVGWLKPGMTEGAVAWELERFMRENGAESLSFDSIVASGPRGALPHAHPTDQPLTPGELVTLDFGCVVDGYCSDMTRTLAIGNVDSKTEETYQLVLQAQLKGIDAIRPGVTGKEVDRVARDVIEAAGHKEHFGHGLGHGVGLDVHEDPPRLSTAAESDVPLDVGMVTSVEPGVYIPDWGGVRIEDLVVVTPDGCEVLSKAPKELITVS